MGNYEGLSQTIVTMEIKPGIYQHYKGEDKKYRVIGVGKHSETLEDLVFYEALYDNSMSKLWSRPLESFAGEAETNGQKVPRFKYINDG